MELLEAADVRRKQTEFLDRENDAQMERIIELINITSKTDNFYIYYNNITNNNIKKLHSKGYCVIVLDKNPFFTHKISWK